eukprot:m.21402 g.21402  ORF g.21402 m.21402 type:complete len:232 (-) comp8720_c0_seq1:125-820(-)
MSNNTTDLHDILNRELGVSLNGINQPPTATTSRPNTTNNSHTNTTAPSTEDNNSSSNNNNNNNSDDVAATATKKKKNHVFDEAKLLNTENGIPYMYETFCKHIKFHNKPGYESHNLRMLMDQYDVWMDQLVPNVVIPDVVNSIEKLGHKSAVKTYLQGLRFGLSVEQDGDDEGDEDEEDEGKQGAEERNSMEGDGGTGQLARKKAKKMTAQKKPVTKRRPLSLRLTGIATS